MKVDADGKPLVGTRRNMLGVRPADPTSATKRKPDVAAVNDTDLVSPGEGLSTSSTPATFRVDRGEAIFEIETADVGPELVENPDNPPHTLLQPAAAMPLGEFQQTLADTRDLWKRVQ
jgi:hypothetical protein